MDDFIASAIQQEPSSTIGTIATKIRERFPQEASDDVALVRAILQHTSKLTAGGGDDDDDDLHDVTQQVDDLDPPIDASLSNAFGDIVWAKNIASDPWWPSIICDPRLLHPTIKKNDELKEKALKGLTLQKTKYLVYYYGANGGKGGYGHATSSSQIKDYLQYRVEYEGIAVASKYREDWRMAVMIADKEVLLPKASRRVWMRTQLPVVPVENAAKGRQGKKKKKAAAASEAAVLPVRADFFTSSLSQVTHAQITVSISLQAGLQHRICG